MLSWPDRNRLRVYFFSLASLMVIFVAVYGATNAHGAVAPNPYQFWFPFELQIPLVPEFIFIYVSLNVLILLPLFAMSSNEITAFSLSLLFEIVIAGIIFYFFPAPIGWARPALIERYDEIFKFVYQLDQTANTFPSLHICFSYAAARTMAAENRQLRFLWTWFFLICASVVLTHQHHLLDIAGGVILAETGYRGVYLKFLHLKKNP